MKNKRGYTLIELIVTMAILGIISISIFSIFNTGFLNIIRAGKRTEAVNVAQTELMENPIIVSDTIKSIPIDLPLPGGGTSTRQVTGSMAKGSVDIEVKSNTKFKVEINAFVPGLYPTIE